MPKKRLKTNIITAKRTNSPVQDKVFGICLLIVVAIMPLFVRLAIVRIPPELVPLVNIESEHVVDFFSYSRGWLLGIPATIIALYSLFDLLVSDYANIDFKGLLKSPPVIASGIFLLMALISAIFSRYRFTSWAGAMDRGEGMLILIAYFIVFFTAMFHVREAKHAKFIMYGLTFSSIIMGLVGLGQFLGRDFFTTSFAAWLVTGSSENVLNARFTFANGTLYNPNTFGKYTAMVAPILLACALAYDGRKWMRIVFFAGGGLMLVGILGSRSLGGFVGIIAAVAVLMVTLVCRLIYQMLERRKDDNAEPVAGRTIAIWAASVAVAAALLTALYFVPPINQRIEFAMGRLELAIRAEPMDLYNFAPDENRLTVGRGDDELFTIVLNEIDAPADQAEDNLDRHYALRMYDATGQQVMYTSRHESEGESAPWPIIYNYEVPGYQEVHIQHIPMGILFRNIGLTYHEGRMYGIGLHHALGQNEDLINLDVPAIGFAGRELWGSSRGYIWSRTLPLMPSRTIIGSGPDTYTQIFPRDVLGKHVALGNPHHLVDKAHNIYMQTWVTTGGISAMALMFLFAYYLLTTFVSLIRTRKNEGSFLHILRFGMLTGISAFAVAAFATDSTIGSMGVFYVLLGLGYGLNFCVKHISQESALQSAA